MGTTQIFNHTGGALNVSLPVSTKDPSFTYVTLIGDKTNPGDTSEALNGILNGRAPVTGIDFDIDVDFEVTRSFNSDFIIAAFGYAPSKLTISGFDILTDCGYEQNKDTVQDFFDKYNLWKNPSARVYVGLTTGGNMASSMFTGVLTSLQRYIRANPDTPRNVGNYDLTFYGVKQ